jgi:hypothetical protein
VLGAKAYRGFSVIYTPLAAAASLGFCGAVSFLLQQGANPNSRSYRGTSVIAHATAHMARAQKDGQDDLYARILSCVVLLVDHGAKPMATAYDEFYIRTPVPVAEPQRNRRSIRDTILKPFISTNPKYGSEKAHITAHKHRKLPGLKALREEPEMDESRSQYRHGAVNLNNKVQDGVVIAAKEVLPVHNSSDKVSDFRKAQSRAGAKNLEGRLKGTDPVMTTFRTSSDNNNREDATISLCTWEMDKGRSFEVATQASPPDGPTWKDHFANSPDAAMCHRGGNLNEQQGDSTSLHSRENRIPGFLSLEIQELSTIQEVQELESVCISELDTSWAPATWTWDGKTMETAHNDTLISPMTRTFPQKNGHVLQSFKNLPKAWPSFLDELVEEPEELECFEVPDQQTEEHQGLGVEDVWNMSLITETGVKCEAASCIATSNLGKRSRLAYSPLSPQDETPEIKCDFRQMTGLSFPVFNTSDSQVRLFPTNNLLFMSGPVEKGYSEDSFNTPFSSIQHQPPGPHHQPSKRQKGDASGLTSYESNFSKLVQHNGADASIASRAAPHGVQRSAKSATVRTSKLQKIETPRLRVRSRLAQRCSDLQHEPCKSCTTTLFSTAEEILTDPELSFSQSAEWKRSLDAVYSNSEDKLHNHSKPSIPPLYSAQPPDYSPLTLFSSTT